ncbi:MAG: hypothetical protein COW63_18030 [Bacteroidetes bacterium CG18_big_fil_WC_8_21_14_2_50_41_14]|nr:MAG: hypothetical protein COW63_18030 [Bacteroidetes bacterium CG18_big_fil_WC_8_21_14_2_50_41_14]
MTTLSGVEGLTTVNDGLFINSNFELENVYGLNNVTLVGGKLMIKANNKLTTLNGLGNIAAESIDSINISGNLMLSTCHVQSVCDFIATPDAVVYIVDNAEGCNNETEVDSACQSLNVPELKFGDYYSIYPVPAHDKLQISVLNGAVMNSITVYNQFGQKVIFIKPTGTSIDISGLNPGLYIIEIQDNKNKLRGRFIVR